MALTVSTVGNANSTTSSATLSISLTASAAVNDTIIVSISARPAGTSGAISISSVEDSQSNVYSLLRAIRSQGIGNTGASVAQYFAVVTKAMTTSDTITVNFSPNTPEKAAIVHKVVAGTNNVLTYVSNSGAGSAGSVTSISQTRTGYLNGDLAIGALAIRNSGAVTGDSDTTSGSWATILTEVADTGTSSTSAQIAVQTKLVTGTSSQTWNVTFGTALAAYFLARYKESPIVFGTAVATLGDAVSAGTATVLTPARFYLDQSTLDDLNFGLDGPSPGFVFDTSTGTLDGIGLLDGVFFRTDASGTATLGDLSAVGTAESSIAATASAELGALQAQAEATVVDDTIIAAADLGGLTAAATADVTVSATAAASLGGLVGVASGSVTITATATATLGSLDAAGTASVVSGAIADAPLGSLVAEATAEIPTPPTPAPLAGGGRRYSTVPKQTYERPVVEPVVEITPTKPIRIPNTVTAIASVSAGLSAAASGMVTFSAEDDDLQVLLML